MEQNYMDPKQNGFTSEFKQLLKICQAPTALLSKAGALFLNWATCRLKSAKIRDFSECEAPTLGNYGQSA